MTQQQAIPIDPAVAATMLQGMTHETSEGGSPLRHYFGKLEAIPMFQGTPQSNKDGSVRNSMELHYQFSELKVMASVVPYEHPTYVHKIYLGDMSRPPGQRTLTGIWFHSIGAILGEQSKPLDAVGKVLEIMWTSGHERTRLNETSGQWEQYESEAFEVISIDGVKAPNANAVPPVPTIPPVPPMLPVAGASAPSPIEPSVYVNTPVVDIMTRLAQVADGCNHPAWMQQVVALPEMKEVANEPLYTSMMSDNGAAVIQALMAAGHVVIETDGTYHTA